MAQNDVSMSDKCPVHRSDSGLWTFIYLHFILMLIYSNNHVHLLNYGKHKTSSSCLHLYIKAKQTQ